MRGRPCEFGVFGTIHTGELNGEVEGTIIPSSRLVRISLSISSLWTTGNLYYFVLIHCYVAISVFNQSRPGQRINSLHVIETDAAYRNSRFRSIPLYNYQGWGSRKRNYLLRIVQIITKKIYKF